MKSSINTKVLPSIKTDPALVEIAIKLSGLPRGPEMWKLNTSLLQDEKYKNETKMVINNAWNELKENNDLSLRLLWVKYKIRQFSITYSKEKAKIMRENKFKQNEIERLDIKICNEQITDSELGVYKELKKNLEQIEEYKVREAWVRPRLEHLESDEKSTAFLNNKSKQIYDKKTITTLQIDNSREILDPKDILKELEIFYCNLYKSTIDRDEKNQNLISDSDIYSTFTDKQ